MRRLATTSHRPNHSRRRALFLERLEDRQVLSTFMVVNTNDSGAGSLRQAILDANGNHGHDDVHFNIPGPGTHTIAPQTLLPSAVNGSISIDASTQPGFTYAGPRLIELSGANITPAGNQYGLVVNSSGSLVRGLAISGFFGSINVHGVSNVRIESNYLGLDPAGASAHPWVYERVQMNGLSLSATSNTIVGGLTDETRNVISSNFVGIQLSSNASNNRILGNYIGTDATGLQPLWNQTGIHLFGPNPGNYVGESGHGNIIVGSELGVLVQGASNNVFQANSIGPNVNGVEIAGGVGMEVRDAGGNGNLIGGSSAGTRNLITGGVLVRSGAHHNSVQGNYIGVNPTGTERVTWRTSVEIQNGSYDNVIGTDGNGVNDSAEGNLIANSVGIHSAGSTNNVVAGNLIGTTASGLAALANNPSTLSASSTVGVSIAAASNNRIGTNGDGVSDEAERNVISGGFDVGVRTIFSGAERNVIAGNYIGTNKMGTSELPNRIGVELGGFNNRLGSNGDGVNDAAERNIISGNREWGVSVGGAGNVVAGNYIGTDASGLTALPNGIGVNLGAESTIGGASAALRNVISGNSQAGIDTRSGPATGAAILGNYIGVDKTGSSALGNGQDGIWLRYGSTNVTVGGTAPGAGNVIAHNGRNGVTVSETLQQFTPIVSSTGNSIRGNSIYANAGLGIDLVPRQWNGTGSPDDGFRNFHVFGVTPNDPLDADGGNNQLQNFPVLSFATWGASTRVTGSLHSTPNQTFVVDFYANSAADPTTHGEGQRWLGSVSIATDSDGNAPINVLFSALTSAGEFISATATDASGNTSEFAAVVAAIVPTNSPPTANAGPDQTRNQGQVVAFGGTGSFDSDGTIVRYDWNFGDGSSYVETASSAPDGAFDGRTTHLYSDNGAYSVTLTVTDNLTATGGDSASVAVQNVAPTVDAGPNLSVTLGGAVTLNGAFNDPGRALGETYVATIIWGDGQSNGGVVNVGAGTITGSHQYATAGNYTVTVTVVDNGDPASGQSAIQLSGSDTTAVVVIQPVTVNILPESINVESNGALTVVIFGAADFNVTQIDVSTVRFAGAGVWQSSLVDANNDGRLDLQVKFRRQDTILDQIYAQLLADDQDEDGVLDSTQQRAQVAVTGETLDDALFSGSDSINLFLAGRSLRNLLDQLFGS